MRNKRSVLVALYMVFFSFSLAAQQDYLREPDDSRPLLFASMPAIVTIPVTSLDRLLTLSPGEAVAISLGEQFQYNGTVTSITAQNDNALLTVIIKAADGSFLTLSKIIHADKTISYIARVLSFQHGDCLILEKKDDNTYSFIKKNFYKIVGE